MAKRKPKPKTKMIWELEPGDFGRLRDRKRTLVYASEIPTDKDDICIQTIERIAKFAWASHLKDDPNVGDYHKIKDKTVDLLDITLE